jgi:heptosyltransferase-3
LFNKIVFQLYFKIFKLLSKWFPARPVNFADERFERILVFSAAGIGDTLTDSVAIRALKETYPKARVYVVTHRRRACLAQHNPFVDEVIFYHKSFIMFFHLVLTLRAKRPNVIVMLRGNDPDLWPMAFLINRHAIVSCPVMTQFKFLISHPIEIPNWDQLHGVEQTLEIIRYFGADTMDKRLIYQVTKEEVISLCQKLNTYKDNDLPIVVFQLGGGRRSAWRDWPVQNFATLGKQLLTTYRAQLVLLGGSDLKFKANELRPLLPEGTLDLVGKLTLTESAALLSESKVLVSTDTGIMHLGFAVGIDTLALIHCHNPASRVGPYGYEGKNLVAELQPPPGTAPTKNVSMDLLPVPLVWYKLEKLCERQEIPKILNYAASRRVHRTKPIAKSS